jgi:hypothetical protein
VTANGRPRATMPKKMDLGDSRTTKQRVEDPRGLREHGYVAECDLSHTFVRIDSVG